MVTPVTPDIEDDDHRPSQSPRKQQSKEPEAEAREAIKQNGTANDGRLITDQYLGDVLQLFPAGMSFAFAYGSAMKNRSLQAIANGHVHKGEGDEVPVDNELKMLDLIFVVDDPERWHAENLAMNPDHYSFLGYFGAANITRIQRRMKAQVYFNVVENFRVKGHDTVRSIKYGVIHTADLVDDLVNWDNLYVAGRLHKPVHVLRRPSSPQLVEALRTNSFSAVHAALLMLDATFTEEQLFTTISALSYAGDFRMVIGEDRNKVRDIVTAQLQDFRRLYKPLLLTEEVQETLSWHQADGLLTQSHGSQHIRAHLSRLPLNIRQRLQISPSDLSLHANEVLQVLMQPPEAEKQVRKAVEDIVWISSINQGIKGFFTSGIIKAIKYCARKLTRMYSSL